MTDLAKVNTSSSEEDDEIDTANDGIPGDKVLTDDLNAGDHVLIKLKGIAEPVECVVLYDKTSEHATNGVQVVTADTIGNKVTLGADESGQDQWIPASMANESYIEKAKWSYNNVIDNLNNLARSYMNTNYVVSARCVGSNPDNPTDSSNLCNGLDEPSDSSYYDEDVDTYVKTIKFSDHNVVTADDVHDEPFEICGDLSQMDSLHIIATGSYGNAVYKGFWFASRTCELIDINNCRFEILGISEDMATAMNEGSEGTTVFMQNETETLIRCDSYNNPWWSSQSFINGFRPCFTLKPGIKVSRISENGTNGPGGLTVE